MAALVYSVRSVSGDPCGVGERTPAEHAFASRLKETLPMFQLDTLVVLRATVKLL